MNLPTDGYDDQSIIPRKRLTSLLKAFESSLDVIQQIGQRAFSVEFETTSIKDKFAHFEELKKTAQEAGSGYLFLIDKLLHDYALFTSTPNQEQLEQLFSDVKHIQLLLVE